MPRVLAPQVGDQRKRFARGMNESGERREARRRLCKRHVGHADGSLSPLHADIRRHVDDGDLASGQREHTSKRCAIAEEVPRHRFADARGPREAGATNDPMARTRAGHARHAGGRVGVARSGRSRPSRSHETRGAAGLLSRRQELSQRCPITRSVAGLPAGPVERSGTGRHSAVPLPGAVDSGRAGSHDQASFACSTGDAPGDSSAS
jgi:hypothetical protein